MYARRWGKGEMPSVEERVAYLEGRLEDHMTVLNDLRAGQIDLRAGQVDLRRELQTGLAEIRSELSALREQVDRRFTWMVGTQVAVLVAVVGALVGSVYR